MQSGRAEQRGEQMPEVVGENLGGLHPGFGAQRFHFPPDLAAGDRLSAAEVSYPTLKRDSAEIVYTRAARKSINQNFHAILPFFGKFGYKDPAAGRA